MYRELTKNDLSFADVEQMLRELSDFSATMLYQQFVADASARRDDSVTLILEDNPVDIRQILAREQVIGEARVSRQLADWFKAAEIKLLELKNELE